MIPKPFSRAVMIFGDPIEVPQDGSPEAIELARTTLEKAMHELEQEAERRMGHTA